MPDIISTYFPDLTPKQLGQLEALYDLYNYWNARINVISRKDMDNFLERHVLHSLSIARVIRFSKGTRILDLGTGGGFPGIPLAIFFPDIHFLLADSIGKKIKVVNAVAEELQLNNVETAIRRAETIERKFHFIVSRAVTNLPEFLGWVSNKIDRDNFNSMRNGILYLKGGDLNDELAAVKKSYRIFHINDFFGEEFFETKKIVYLDMTK